MKIKKFSQINENKLDNSQEIYEFNLTFEDIRKIILLIMDTDFDVSKYDTSQISLSTKEHPKFGKYIHIDIPMVNKEYTEYKSYGFEIKIYKDGFISYENGSDVKMKFDNALEIYSILLKKMK